jgi:hypothetical protein
MCRIHLVIGALSYEGAHIKDMRDLPCAAKELYDEENSDSNGSCGPWYENIRV